jgi:hypothetical protein
MSSSTSAAPTFRRRSFWPGSCKELCEKKTRGLNFTLSFVRQHTLENSRRSPPLSIFPSAPRSGGLPRRVGRIQRKAPEGDHAAGADDQSSFMAPFLK